MKDIISAIRYEEEYISYRLHNEEPYAFIDKLKECGYNTFDEYFNDKIDYQIKTTSFSFQEVYPENAAQEMLKMINKGEAGLLLMNTDKTVVYHGDEYYNKEYCDSHNIPVINYFTVGGTLVASEGELSLGICIPHTIDVSLNWLLNKVANYLKQYENNITIDNNDILKDGKKFCGSTIYQNDKCFCAVAQLSFDDKYDLIKNICGINNDKIPTYLSNVTREQVREVLKSWLLSI